MTYILVLGLIAAVLLALGYAVTLGVRTGRRTAATVALAEGDCAVCQHAGSCPFAGVLSRPGATGCPVARALDLRLLRAQPSGG